MLKPSVQIHDTDGILIAEFWDCWRLDPAPVQDLRVHYEDRLRRGGRPEIVIDLSGVGFAGSAALGNFVALHRLARQHGGRLIFCHVEPTVTEVFRASKLEPLFEFAPDRASALESLARSPGAGLVEPKPTSNAGPESAPPPALGGRTVAARLRRKNPGPG
jgi:anti-anti-sigma factor